MWTQFLALCKFIFIISLFLVFFYNFGLPSFEMYMRKGVIVRVSKDTSLDSKLASPAITFCAGNLEYESGWKNSSQSLSLGDNSIYGNICPGKEDDQLLSCIDDETYTFDEVILLTKIDNDVGKFKGNFTTDISYAQAGKCFTLKTSRKLGSNFGSLVVSLNKNLAYYIFVHDPEFFFFTSNPRAYPGFFMILRGDEQGEKVHFSSIEVIKHSNLHRPDSICEESLNYSLSDCIKMSISSDVGCKLPWNEFSLKIHTCNTVEQFQRHENLYSYYAASEQKIIINMTGCKLPCSYREFKTVGDPMDVKIERIGFGFGLFLVTTDVRVETEELVYPFVSFVSDFGGALGLFLGFSFLMIWDFVLYMIQGLKSRQWLK